ncbi:DUF6428 family protein [Anatilimnocola sp. NA78]|uniref:DUF6428 family protein n=1 Tax=Anatilimnocola sp. NA78 TaxID=3415683 RepID=UPI003CE4D768
MNIQQLQTLLAQNNESSLRLQLPSGEFIPAHFHVTEVGRVDKVFIDCGGTQRHVASCLLQTWTANDVDHRLESGKLAKILKLAQPILGTEELPVEVEYGAEIAVQYALADVQVDSSALTFVLSGKQTDCLAKDQCGVGECCAPGCCE